MIYFPKSRYQLSQEMPGVASNPITSEGQCLVAQSIGGVFGVRPCSNDTVGNFAGFAVAEQLSLLSVPKVESFVVSGGAATTLQLSRTPEASTLFIFNVTDGVALAVTTDWTLSGDTVTWVNTQIGDTVTCYYRFAPTTVEAQAIQGDVKPGGAAGLLLGQVGVIKSGVVYTSEYDTSVDWLANNPVVKTGAGGRVTIGGAGQTLPAYVISVPHSNGPDGAFLGLEFAAQ